MSETQPTDQSLITAFLCEPDTEEGARALCELLERGFTARDLLTYVERLEAVFAEADHQPITE